MLQGYRDWKKKEDEKTRKLKEEFSSLSARFKSLAVMTVLLVFLSGIVVNNWLLFLEPSDNVSKEETVGAIQEQEIEKEREYTLGEKKVLLFAKECDESQGMPVRTSPKVMGCWDRLTSEEREKGRAAIEQFERIDPSEIGKMVPEDWRELLNATNAIRDAVEYDVEAIERLDE